MSHISRCSRSTLGSVATSRVCAGCYRRAPARQLRRHPVRAVSSAPAGCAIPHADRGSSGTGGPLSGLTVLDCGNFLAGPIVSLHLAAMGADVIKVEKPRNGDDSRAVGPFARDGSSSYHLSTNRGKRSVAIDTRTEAGRKIFLDLATKADVL